MRIFILTLVAVLISSCHTAISAQDSLSISLTDAQLRLMRENLNLLVAKKALQQQKALELQARLIPNPYLQAEHSLFRPSADQLYDPEATTEFNIILSQLIELAGKRGKRISLAQLQSSMAEYAVYDLLRGLSLQMRSDYCNLKQLLSNKDVFDKQLAIINPIVTQMANQYDKGNISLKELTRLRSVQFDLQNQRMMVEQSLQETQHRLRIAFRLPSTTWVIPTVETSTTPVLSFGERALQDTALTRRYDLRATATYVKIQQANLNLQKAQAVPDVNVGFNYDRFASAFKNYAGLQVGIPLPIFNRNQGNIQAAKLGVEQSKLQQIQMEEQVVSEVASTYRQAVQAETNYAQQEPKFLADFDELMAGIALNYQKGNISLLEFLDYFDSYRTGKLTALQLNLTRQLTRENLNYVLGVLLFN